MPNFVLGPNAHAYISTTLVASATLCGTAITSATEMTGIKDLKINLQSDKADVSTRGNGGWKGNVATLKDATLTFTQPWISGDTNLGTVLTAWGAGTPVFVAAMDETATTTGAQGVAGNWVVTSFSRTENLADALSVDVELAAYSCNEWLTK